MKKSVLVITLGLLLLSPLKYRLQLHSAEKQEDKEMALINALKLANKEASKALKRELEQKELTGYERWKFKQVASNLGQYDSIVNRSSTIHELDKSLIIAVIIAESNGISSAVSRAGAKGLMQITDLTADLFGVENPFDPHENIEAGSAYLGYLLRQFNFNLELALAAYNAGPTLVRRLQAVPNYRETKNYIAKVKNIMGLIEA